MFFGDFDDGHGRFHIGLRILKTGLAVFISMVLSRVLGGYPFFAVVAALICMKTTTEDSIHVGFHRLIGTIIGGFSGMGMLYLFQALEINHQSLLYDGVTVLVMMVLIKIMTLVGRSPSVVITCVVYASILLMPPGDHPIFSYSMTRIVDTTLGVMVAIFVNELLPNHHKCQLEEMKETKERATKSDPPANKTDSSNRQ